MDTAISIEGKECTVTLSSAARRAVDSRHRPLVAEVVVTLACCIRKTLNFREPHKDERLYFVAPQLAIALVSGEHKANESDTGCSLPEIKNWRAIAPRWIAVDYRDGIWSGDFGFSGVSRN